MALKVSKINTCSYGGWISVKPPYNKARR